MNLVDAIDHYHALLDEAGARATFEQLDVSIRARGMLVGKARDRLICSVLRPRLLTEAQLATAERAAALVGRAIRKVGAAALETPALLAPFALTAQEQALLAIDPGYPGASAFGRLDGFLAADGSACWFVESNLESPAGNTNGLLSDVGNATFPAWDFTLDDEAAFPAGSFPVYNGLVVAPENVHRLEWFDGENAGGFRADRLKAIAEAAGVDTSDWDACTTDPAVRQEVADSTSKGLAQGVNATPTMFINGTMVTPAGLKTVDELSALIEEAAAAAGTSSASPASASPAP